MGKVYCKWHFHGLTLFISIRDLLDLIMVFNKVLKNLAMHFFYTESCRLYCGFGFNGKNVSTYNVS